MSSRNLSILFLLLFSLITLIITHPTAANTPNATCTNGLADIYPCHNIDLLSQLTLAQLGDTTADARGSDIWGWTDPVTGNEYAIVGLNASTAFVDITDPHNPVYLGSLAGRDGASVWRDIKVYQNHAYIVSDIPTQAGLQVFDLTQLPTITTPPVTFTETYHYADFGSSHNLWADEDSGFLYIFRPSNDTHGCDNGIHIADLTNPAQPTFAACFAVDEAPLSDAECLLYNGPDTDYTGQQICFVGSDDNMSIHDVTDKNNITQLSNFGYNGIARAHQGSLTPDHRYWLMSDTNDEMNNGHNTRTYVFDILDLDAPQYLGFYEHDTPARDHNVYIIDNLAYQTNWMSGLRLLDITSLPSTDFNLVGYFDFMPDSDSITPAGSWSSYPWLADNVIAVSTTDGGLYLVQYNPTTPTDVNLTDITGNTNPAIIFPLLGLLLLLGGLIIIRRRQPTISKNDSSVVK
ncbi:MAG TPA: choice-of-anchor B family protein [Anaerolineae bacterium]|nr:choice-of-anchor B family protein [Anaerolineae bacterium]